MITSFSSKTLVTVLRVLSPRVLSCGLVLIGFFRISKISLLILMSFSFSSCYSMSQFQKQAKLYMSKVPITEVVADPKVKFETKQKLHTVSEAIRFAEAYGIYAKGSYQHFIFMDQPVVSYLVYAGYEDKFALKKHWFPIVGSVPYLGFFDKADRDAKQQSFETKGYNTFKTGATAFSLLGWLDDPVYESMLKRKHLALAHLIFHELTHRNYWKSGDVKFNENLAEYVADYLVVRYAKWRGMDQEYQDYVTKNEDRKKLKAWLKSLRKDMRRYYKRNEFQLTDEKRRQVVLKQFNDGRFPAFSDQKYQRLKKIKWNNARILASSIYLRDFKKISKAHQCVGGNHLGYFLDRLKEKTDYHRSDEAINILSDC